MGMTRQAVPNERVPVTLYLFEGVIVDEVGTMTMNESTEGKTVLETEGGEGIR